MSITNYYYIVVNQVFHALFNVNERENSQNTIKNYVNCFRYQVVFSYYNNLSIYYVKGIPI